MMIIAASDFAGRRLRARRVYEREFAERVARKAIERGEWVCDVEHGGGVANAYKYPADTECVLAISNPMGVVVYWTGRASANKVTERKAAEACLPSAGDYFDRRIKDPFRRQAVMEMLVEKHGQLVPPLLTLAVASACTD